MRMCKALPASAFDLVNPAFSRGRCARRKRGPSMQPHADTRCVVICACYVRKFNRQILFHSMVGTRLDTRCRLRGGLLLRICEPAGCTCHNMFVICHVGCLRAASICWRPSGSRATGLLCTRYHAKSRRAAIQARLLLQNVPCSQLTMMLWLWHTYAVSWELVTNRRPWQRLKATRVIVKTPFPKSHGCADWDWPAIGTCNT